MAYKLLIFNHKKWEKDCVSIPKDDLARINTKIKLITVKPWPKEAHIKLLHNYGVADYRLRAGDYRVLFNLQSSGNTIFLLRVLHRSKLY